MLKIAALLFIILGVTVAGAGLVTVLAVPELAAQSTTLVPLVSILGFALAMPISWLIARKITGSTLARS